MSSLLFARIFPDESDKVINKGILELQSVTTRSGKCNRNASISTSNEELMHPQIKSLDEWKKLSKHFVSCKKICDPLNMFSRSDLICQKCHEVREKLRRNVVFFWTPKELSQLLNDYIYFHAVKVFNAGAEYLFANSKSDHPYFRAYSQVRHCVKIILKNITSSFNFPLDLLSAARRAFMVRKVCSGLALHELRLTWSCKLCDETPEVIEVCTLSGCRYTTSNFELIKSDENEEPVHFTFCKWHSSIFAKYYHLLHMDWNLHWNCHFRLHQILKKSPDLPTSEVISAVNPRIFLTLSQYTSRIFLRLCKFSSSAWSTNGRTVKSLNEGLKSWDRVVKAMKDAGIYRRSLNLKPQKKKRKGVTKEKEKSDSLEKA